jgi:signal transduction histidine kinase
MFSKVSSFYKAIYHTGVDEKLSFSEKQRIELSNLFILIGVPMLLIHSIANFFGPRSLTEFLLGGIWILIFLITYILNKIGRTYFARLFIIIVGILFMGMIHVSFGNEARFEPMYLMSTVCSIYFFDVKTRYKVLAFHFIMIPIFYTLVFTIDPPYAHLLVPTGPIAYFIVSMVVLVIFTFKIINELYIYNRIITDQNDALTSKNIELQNFNHIVSHDLKEPIRNIVSYSSLVKRKLDEGNPIHDYADQIIVSGHQLNNLIEDLRSFQSIDTIDHNYEWFSPEEVIKEIENIYVSPPHVKQGVLQLDSLPESIHFSRMAFYIVCKNLIENALKYNEDSKPMLKIYGDSEQQYHVFHFKDNGIGIEMKYADEIFKMFKRLHHRSRFPGTGLGLNIAAKMLGRFGSRIELTSSEVGRGSLFTIFIPKSLPNARISNG